MNANGNTNHSYDGQMQPPARRQYKRISPHQWEEQKERIRALYIEQEKPMAKVVEIMKDLYGFEAG
jgi:hypothetical protein